jgi:hypothetical protein
MSSPTDTYVYRHRRYRYTQVEDAVRHNQSTILSYRFIAKRGSRQRRSSHGFAPFCLPNILAGAATQRQARRCFVRCRENV